MSGIEGKCRDCKYCFAVRIPYEKKVRGKHWYSFSVYEQVDVDYFYCCRYPKEERVYETYGCGEFSREKL